MKSDNVLKILNYRFHDQERVTDTWKHIFRLSEADIYSIKKIQSTIIVTYLLGHNMALLDWNGILGTNNPSYF